MEGIVAAIVAHKRCERKFIARLRHPLWTGRVRRQKRINLLGREGMLENIEIREDFEYVFLKRRGSSKFFR